jgi:hypothetical protein
MLYRSAEKEDPLLGPIYLLISLAVVSLASPAVVARAVDSPQIPLPSASSTTEQTTLDQCRQQYSALTQDVEAKAEPIRDASHGRLPASAVCKLLTDYTEAELRLISFVEANSNKCGVSHEISEKIKINHATTEKMKGQACSNTNRLKE